MSPELSTGLSPTRGVVHDKGAPLKLKEPRKRPGRDTKDWQEKTRSARTKALKKKRLIERRIDKDHTASM
ncbi:hypothetical protein AMTR_s00027p00212350 [Amborella trichopoda]|uniref:Uncharacterized protein n=1 Tax=Amborella trichopoda TaxID=13333 RepID=W1PLA2_AMBTC|nr:hypothetical protein AMTR_s00027p00212350 [Amborella trichopoda]